jgi:hypothetical protein
MALSLGKIGLLTQFSEFWRTIERLQCTGARFLVLGLRAAGWTWDRLLSVSRPSSSRLDLGSAAQRESAFEQPTGPGIGCSA